MSPRSGWNTLVERRPWLARLMLAACSLSLLATSPDDDDGDYSPALGKSSAAPTCTLTAEAPLCEFLVTLRHEVPNPGEPFFTVNARANVRGVIAASEVTGDAPFVAVRIVSDDQPSADELNALTEFSLQRSLSFAGGCDAANTSTPCVATFVASFRRTDLGDRGGSVNVSWTLELEARAASAVDASAGRTLPWIVEYTPR